MTFVPAGVPALQDKEEPVMAQAQEAKVLYPSSAPYSPQDAPLSRWERRGLIAFALVLVSFAFLVELRSAFLNHRKGDLNVFLRAAWAVRAHEDLYTVTDDNGFHYCYPPLLAILAAPLADPPAGADRSGMLPYSASVGICYVFNVACLTLAMHLLAGAVEGLHGPRVGSRRWWSLRFWPVLACLVPIGHTLMRGQVNLLLLLLLSGAIAAAVRGHSFRSGLWLAGAICLKIIPAFLLLYPLWRRDLRFLLGCAAGLVVGLILIPVAVLGPAWTADCYNKLTTVLIAPGLGVGEDQSRAEELTNVTATDSQSVLAVLHNTLHSDVATRPAKASPAVRLAGYLICGAMTLLTLAAAGWRRSADPLAALLLWGCLILDMVLLSPVCHLHYFSLSAVLVLGLIAARWRRQDGLWPGSLLLALFVFGAVANLLPHLPSLIRLRDGGLAMYAALALWLLSVLVLRKCVRDPIPALAESIQVRPAA
jgi:hypothetical protein